VKEKHRMSTATKTPTTGQPRTTPQRRRPDPDADIAAGRVSPTFTSWPDAAAYLRGIWGTRRNAS
jgi:hypothetical protein